MYFAYKHKSLPIFKLQYFLGTHFFKPHFGTVGKGLHTIVFTGSHHYVPLGDFIGVYKFVKFVAGGESVKNLGEDNPAVTRLYNDDMEAPIDSIFCVLNLYLFAIYRDFS